MTYDEWKALDEHPERRIVTDRRGRTSKHLFVLAQYGVKDITITAKKMKNAVSPLYGCTIIVNLQRVVNNGVKSIDTYDNEANYPKLSDNFSKYMSILLPQKQNINQWEVQRIDYNIDLRMTQNEVENYIELLQMGDKHSSWDIHNSLKPKGVLHPDGSVIYSNKQYSINIYDKHKERKREQERRGVVDEKELKESEGVLRVEVQVKRGKLNSIKKAIKGKFDIAGKPLEFFARYEVAVPVLINAVKSISGYADYTTLSNASECVTRRLVSNNTSMCINEFIRLVGHLKSLYRAKSEYKGRVRVDTILKHLERMNINPVTIPVRFKCKYMKNIMELILTKLSEQMSGAYDNIISMDSTDTMDDLF